ncbi:hypothetical protein ACOMCU_01430 [Lysinibacillus sp. UGB7]|uniref:hypothetical protein n=1 Tax=Lysinibacillus sp. UGB7 TaxID=3411039 RepID=UPI003B7B1470
MEFNQELFEILLKCETHIYSRQEGIELIAFVPFDELEDFTNALSASDLDEGGIASSLVQEHVCVELQDLFEYNDYRICDYADCFSKDELKQYAAEIATFDGDK